MNMIKKFGLFVLLGFFAVACNKNTDEPGNPVVNATAAPTSAAPGDIVAVSINATADAARTLKNLKIEEITSGTSGSVKLLDSAINVSNIGFTYKYSVPMGSTGTKTIRVTATDNGPASGTKEVVITITSASGISAYSMVMLPAPTADKTSKSFFSSMSGKAYSFNDVTTTSDPISATIDFGYYYTSKATLAAPASTAWTSDIKYTMASWTKRNNTKFKTTTMTKAEFDAATPATINDAANGASVNNISDIATGQVIAFVTESGKNGLIYVEDLKPGTGGGDYIKIDVKVLK